MHHSDAEAGEIPLFEKKHTTHARERIWRVYGVQRNQSGAGHDEGAAEDLGRNPQTCS